MTGELFGYVLAPHVEAGFGAGYLAAAVQCYYGQRGLTVQPAPTPSIAGIKRIRRPLTSNPRKGKSVEALCFDVVLMSRFFPDIWLR